MPRTPRNSPRPPGRPRKDLEAAEALAIQERTDVSEAEAAKAAGISERTLRAAKSRSRAGQVASVPSGPAAAPSASGAHQGPADDPWWALRQILDGLHPRVTLDVQEGLALYASQGPGTLLAWLRARHEAQPLTADQRAAILESIEAAAWPEQAAQEQGVPPERWRALLVDEELAAAVATHPPVEG